MAAAPTVAAMVVGAVVLVVTSAATSSAHNSRTAFAGVYGPYDVVATARYVHDAQAQGVLLELTVRAAATRDAVEDASVEVRARAGARSAGPLDADRYGNVYRVLLPGDDVDRWQLDATIASPAGEVSFTELVPGALDLRRGVPTGYGHTAVVGAGGWLLVGGLASVVALAGLTRWWRPAMWAAGIGLLVSTAVVVVGAWSDSSAPPAARAAGLLAPLLAASFLLGGMKAAGNRADGALLAVFAGAAALGTLYGWLHREVFEGEATTDLPPTVAVAAAVGVMGLAAGLVGLVTARFREPLAQLRTPRPPASRRQPRPGPGRSTVRST